MNDRQRCGTNEDFVVIASLIVYCSSLEYLRVGMESTGATTIGSRHSGFGVIDQWMSH